jgi:hypothetical protein
MSNSYIYIVCPTCLTLGEDEVEVDGANLKLHGPLTVPELLRHTDDNKGGWRYEYLNGVLAGWAAPTIAV